MKKINPLFALFIISFWIGFYQINLIETKLNSYKISNHLSSQFSFGLHAQQFVENTKIYIKGLIVLDEEDLAGTHTEIASSKIEPEKPVLYNETTPLIEMNKKCTEKCIILTIGDSIMGDVYYSLSRQLKKHHPDWKIVDAHKVSSGLSNSTYYNWPNVAQKLIDEIKPDYVVILIGMNDAQGLTENNKGFQFNSTEWNRVYKERTQKMFNLINTRSTAYWIELPNVKADAFDKRLSYVREIHKTIADKNYINVKNLLGDNQDPQFLKFRQVDGVHLNAIGSDLIADYIYTNNLN